MLNKILNKLGYIKKSVVNDYIIEKLQDIDLSNADTKNAELFKFNCAQYSALNTLRRKFFAD